MCLFNDLFKKKKNISMAKICIKHLSKVASSYKMHQDKSMKSFEIIAY